MSVSSLKTFRTGESTIAFCVGQSHDIRRKSIFSRLDVGHPESTVVLPLTTEVSKENAIPLRVRIPVGTCGLDRESDVLWIRFLPDPAPRPVLIILFIRVASCQTGGWRDTAAMTACCVCRRSGNKCLATWHLSLPGSAGHYKSWSVPLSLSRPLSDNHPK